MKPPHKAPPLASALAAAALGLALALLAAAPAAATPPADLQLQFVANGFTRPVTLRSPRDGSHRMFVVQQPGVIKIIDLTNNTVLSTPFLDIQSKVDDAGNEQGLLGLAFHPDFANNGTFYVDYTRDPGAGNVRTVIERYQVSKGNPDVADPTSAVTLLEIEQPFSNHNGGDIDFGPDGYLYIGMGDGGSGNDPFDNAQHLTSLLGKMLRIDVDHPTPGTGAGDYCGINPNGAYSVPATNPWAGGSGDCDEIWARGVRNPWRWSFDRQTGDLLIGDVGQGPSNPREEIDFQPASSTGGENYGWSCMEGFQTPNYNPCEPGPLTPPIYDYDHSVGNAITGGFRYRGADIPGLQGIYLFSDSGSGRIWFATETSPGVWSVSLWENSGRSIVTFGEDDDGELYLADLFPGEVDKFVSPSSGTIFADGFESGDTSAWSTVFP